MTSNNGNNNTATLSTAPSFLNANPVITHNKTSRYRQLKIAGADKHGSKTNRNDSKSLGSKKRYSTLSHKQGAKFGVKHGNTSFIKTMRNRNQGGLGVGGDNDSTGRTGKKTAMDKLARRESASPSLMVFSIPKAIQ